jgi:hypothetical protein
MLRLMKWSMPLLAVAAVLAFGASTVRAEDAAGKGSVSGTVLDKDGKPAAGVHVRLFHPFEKGQRGKGAAKKEGAETNAADPAEGGSSDKPAKGSKGDKPMRDKPVATATTDSNGAFSMKDVPAGKYIVMAMLKGQGGARQEVEVTAGSEAKAELKLEYRDKAKDKAGNKEEKKAAKAQEKAERKLEKKSAA